MNLKTTVKKLLSDSIRMCDSCKDAQKLKEEILNFEKRLEEPLKVAVIGFMKAGKSTLMNAILKDKILFTGGKETTSNHSWFKYGKTKSITVVFKDGLREDYPYEDLEKWTTKEATEKNPRARDVIYVEIKYPNEVLKSIELIDTPGFGTKSDGADKALDFLGVNEIDDTSDEIQATRITVEMAAQADAIVYAFSRGANSRDRDILESFQGGNVSSNTSPINAVGVLTRADFGWNPMENNDPIESAGEVCGNMMNEPAIKNLLYTIMPVSAKLVEDIVDIGDVEWSILERISKLDDMLFLNIISDSRCFVEWEAEDFENALEEAFSEEQKHYICSSSERKRIFDIFAQYGISLIRDSLKKGITRKEILEFMYKKSGIERLSNLIYDHFGNRSFIIKVKFMFSHLSSSVKRLMHEPNTSSELYSICDEIKESIDNIESTEQIFRELKILQNYYNGVLMLSDEEEVRNLMEVTGEHGIHCEAKLGVEPPKSIKELSELAKERICYWNERANDIPNTRYYEEAAQVLARSYSILNFHLETLLGE